MTYSFQKMECYNKVGAHNSKKLKQLTTRGGDLGKQPLRICPESVASSFAYHRCCKRPADWKRPQLWAYEAHLTAHGHWGAWDGTGWTKHWQTSEEFEICNVEIAIVDILVCVSVYIFLVPCLVPMQLFNMTIEDMLHTCFCVLAITQA